MVKQSIAGSSKINIPPMLMLGVSLLFAGGAIFSFYKYYQAQNKLDELLKEPTQAMQNENEKLLEKVGKLAELPDEVPTFATVTDKNSLTGQTFFARAENGDRVILFPIAKKALLYRPSTNKVIEFSPVSIGNNVVAEADENGEGSTAGVSDINDQNNQDETPNEVPVRVTVLNGSNYPENTEKGAILVETALENINHQIVAKVDAINKYDSTTVIDVSSKNANVANMIAPVVGGYVQNTLPFEEDTRGGEVVVIIGNDF